MFRNIRICLAALLSLSVLGAQAQLSVSSQTDLQQLAASITGPGVVISNPQVTCHNSGFGEFTYSGSQLGVEHGVILTSGMITNALGPNNSINKSFQANTSGDGMLDIVTGRSTRDACAFEFDIIPAGDSLHFDFVFGSEEYNEWVGSQFNDVFGFFISGPGITGDPGIGSAHNIALVPDTNIAVAINNINNGSNSAYYHDNSGGSETQYDGYTVGLSARSQVTPCSTYHLKLVVADASDRKLDSGVLINQVESNPVSMTSFTANGTPSMVEGCNPGWVRFTRTNVTSSPLTLQYYLDGTATNGTDYTAIGNINPLVAKSITIPANQAYVDRQINPIADALAEPTETIRFILGNPFCPAIPADSLIIAIEDTLIATVQPVQATICRGDSMQYHIVGGNGYVWTPSTGLSCTTCADPLASPPSTTTYTITITEGTCSRTVNRQLRVSNLALSAVVTHPLCDGATNGAINLSVTGSLAPITYSWTGPNGFTSTAQDISGRGAGTYTVTVTDAACVRSQSFNLVAPAALAVSVAPNVLAFGQNIRCHGGNDGLITSTITGGTGPYTISWSGPAGYSASTANISGLIAGAYTINVTDAHGCTVATSTTLVEASQVSAALVSSTPVTCFGDGAGSAEVSGSGGVPPYTYSWNTSPVQNTATATGLPSGTWIATVRDGNNCPATVNAVIAGPTATLTASVGARTHVLCKGNSTGSASVNVSGGTLPYTYEWNTVPAQNTATASNLAAGIYACTVTDVNGCITSVNAVINEPATSLSASLFAQTNVLCFGNNTGSATVNATGGTGPYSYSWNTTPVKTTATANNLIAGTWTCTITDVNGCSTTQAVTIAQPAAALAATMGARTNVLCFGNSTGNATVNVTGGAPPYTYAWNSVPTQNTATASNLPAGTFTCTVTDANGCTATRNVTITQPAATLNATISASINVLCFGLGIGSASVLATGGTAPYTYSWNSTPTQSNALALNLLAGTYTCTVHDANGCVTTATVSILQPMAVLTANISATTNVSCFGSSTGSATVTASGGAGGYSYSWNSSPVQSTATASGLPAGTFTCTITDANGCSISRNATITQPASALAATISGTNVLCFGNTTGAASVSASGGTSPYSYSWNSTPAQNTASATNLPAGSYTCTITDAKGCSITRNITLTQPAAALASSIASQTNVLCFGNNTGAATVSVSGGSTPYSYSWNTSPVQNSASATNLVAGTYVCTITDAHGCTRTSSATITQPSAVLTANVQSQTNVLCFGNATGSATVSVSGGNAPYTFSWNSTPVQGTAAASSLPAGTYTCTITDANGCSAAPTATITQPFIALSMSGFVTSASCGGSATGAVDVTPSGGTTPYGYAWTGPSSFTATTQDITGLVSGVYALTITDANGCSRTQSFNVAQPGFFTISGTTSAFAGGHEVSCAGATNGSIAQTISGGTAPYSISWTGPGAFTASVEDLTNLGAGTYTMVLSDANGCSTSATYVLDAPSVLSVTLAANTVVGGFHIACNGASTGAIDGTITGGTAPYTTTWTGPNGFSSSAIDNTGLTAGPYSVTITDANGCIANASITLTQPAALTTSISGSAAVSCFGGNNGSAQVTASGGTLPLIYAWNTSPVQDGASATGLSVGSYTCTITDANGCVSTSTTNIAQPAAALSASISAQTNVLIFGQSTGSATTGASGGSPAYTYSWNTTPAQNSATATNLSAGTYICTVTDAHGCTTTASVTITQPGSALTASISGQTDVLCFGNATGSATVTANGGTPGYSYSWNTTPMQIAATATGLSAGTWTVTILDANGATTNTSVTIAQPTAALSASVSAQMNAGCRGANTGSASIAASGGTAPYTYLWNTTPAQNSAGATGLTAGTYSCIVTDAQGCSTSVPVTITQPAASLSASISGTTNVLCFGNSTGSATVTAAGGTTPYSYDWNSSPQQITATAGSLPTGSYTVTVTDAHGCTTTASTSITQPTSAVSVSIGSIHQATCGNNNGWAIATPAGGTVPYSYSWNSIPMQNTAQASGLAPGTYSVAITDGNGCSTSASTTITAPLSLAINVVSTVGQNCFGSTNGQATVSASGGTTPYAFAWNTAPVQHNATAVGLSAGSYIATVTDANGCTAQVTATITGPTAPLALTVTSNTPVLCNGESTGAATVAASGGTAPYGFSWNTTPVTSSATASNLAAGTYTVQVLDAHGCNSSTNVSITQPASPIYAHVGVSQNVSCFGANDGFATLEISGGSGNYSVVWNTVPVQTGATAVGLAPGVYTVSITDNNGCGTPKQHPVTIGGPTTPIAVTTLLSNYDGYNTSCSNSSDGSIDLSVTGGTGPYTYGWNDDHSGFFNTQDLSGLDPDNYHLTVTDVNGCVLNTTVPVNGPPALDAPGSITAAACQGSADGAIDVSTGGGIAPYTFQWNGPGGVNAVTEDISGLLAGVYTLSVTDAHECVSTFTYDVNQPGLFTISAILSDFNGNGVSCANSTNGSIDLTATGGTVPYAINWSGPNGFASNAEDLTGLGGGTYALHLIDANGCGTLQEFVLITPTALSTTLSEQQYNSTQISCNGNTDGSINSTITGGTPGYASAWTGPNGFSANTEDIGLLGAGSYSVTITDANGCTTTGAATLEEPTPLSNSAVAAVFANGNEIACNGGSNGSIDLSVSGGHAPYSIDWSGPNGFTSDATDLSGLPAGVYTAVITDANGCSAAASALLSEPAPTSITASLSSFNGGAGISCFGLQDGSIDLTLTGGAGGPVVQWLGPNAFASNAQDLNTLFAGDYHLHVIDLNGCVSDTLFSLAEPAPIVIDGTAVPAICQGSNNGALNIAVNGGTAPYDYFWSGPAAFTDSTSVLDSLYAGVYTVHVTDNNGCEEVGYYNVNEPGTLIIDATLSDYAGGYQIHCAGDSSGSISAEGMGGSPGYYYFWQGPDGYTSIDQNVGGLAAGQYALTLTDSNGCTTLGLYTLSAPTPVNIGLVPSLFPGGANVTCNSIADGSIDAIIAGGIAPYTFDWNGPLGAMGNNEDLTGLPAGTYTVTVTDAVGCGGTTSIALIEPTPITPSLTLSDYPSGGQVSCAGSTDGTIDLAISGGNAPYGVQWTGPNSFTSQQLQLVDLAPGTYTALITDALGCSTSIVAQLVEPAPIAIAITASTAGGGFNIACAGGSEGTLSAQASAGGGSYQYVWHGPNAWSSAGANATGLVAGYYLVQVLDNNGCTAVAGITLTAPQPVASTTLISDVGNGYQVSCTGGDGSIDLSPSGGVSPFQIAWTGPNGFGSQAEDINGLDAGTYYVNIIDANGCAQGDTVQLAAPAQLNADLIVSGNICDGTDDGAIDLTITGGTAPYSFVWNGPDGFTNTTEDIDSLPGGTFTVQVTDAGTCSGTWNATIIASSHMELGAYLSDYGNFNIPCAGDAAGVIELALVGGAQPVNITWSGPNGFSSNAAAINGLLAGDYTAFISDANGCSMDTTLTLTAPIAPVGGSLLASAFPSGTQVSCNGGSDGSIDLTVTGGTAPFTYQWRSEDSTIFSTEDIAGLASGTYEVVVTDTNQCAFTTSITLSEPDSALAMNVELSQYTGGSNVSCNGSTDGSIAVVISGGNGSNTFTWTGPNGFTSNADSIGDIAAGTYSVSVADMNGCAIAQDIEVVAPQPMQSLFTPSSFAGGNNISCAGLNDGSLSISIQGGTPEYAVLWNGPNGYSASDTALTDLLAGQYCATITDANACTANACFELIEPAALNVATVSAQADCGQSTGAIDATVTGGSAPFTYDWSNGAQTEDVTGIPVNTYTVTVTDANHCSATSEAHVIGAPGIAASGTTSAVLCNGNSDGFIDLTVTTGTAPYTFNWSNSANSEDIGGLNANTYTVTVTDASGCTWTDAFIVDQPLGLEADTTISHFPNGHNVSVYGGHDGTITVEPQGGIPPYTVTWNNGSSGTTQEGLSAGTYVVTITDANGCYYALEITLTAPTGVEMPTGFTPNEDGKNDAFVVHGIEGFRTNELMIFNRWGNKVFDQLNYRNDWRGENQQGEQLPNGTYFVILRLNEGELTLQNYVDLRR